MEKTFGGDDNDGAFSVTPTGDRGFIIAEYSKSFGNGKKDIYPHKDKVVLNANLI